MKNALITGSSSGIGYSTCKKFLNEGFKVFGTVRSDEDAERLKAEFGKHFIPLIFDIRDRQAIENAQKKLAGIIGEFGLDCLVNNAGISISGPLLHVPVDEFKKQFEVNVFGTLHVIQAFARMLKGDESSSKKPGRLVNVSSMSGLITRPILGPYSASKFALEAMSDALRRELMVFGIKVIIIEPGPIKTAIWQKAIDDHHTYKGTVYEAVIEHFNEEIEQLEKKALPPKQVANLIYKTVFSPNPKTRYRIGPNALQNWLAIHVLGDKLLDKLFYKHISKLAKT